MKRKLIAQLENWRDSIQKKPLILTGAKGTGKTYLALTFANTFYDTYVYWNFENNPVDVEGLLQAGKVDLAAFFTCGIAGSIIGGRNNIPSDSYLDGGRHLFILDEIMHFKEFKLFLALLKQHFPGKDILCISSKEPDFTKGGKEQETYQYLRLHPLDFEEFLMATGNEWYIEVIKEQYRNGSTIPGIVHKELLELLEEYLYVGGLPLAVNEYVTTGCRENITELHRNILFSYLFDTGLQKSDGCALKVKQMLYSLPEQLSKRNKKFQYTLIRKGATEALFLEGHAYLKDTYFGIYNRKITDEEIENPNEEKYILQKNPGTKIYLFDIGLYHSLARITGIKNEKDFREGLLEAYTAQALYTAGLDFGYWEAASMSCSLFLLNGRREVNTPLRKSKDSRIYLPVEIRETGVTRSKGISSFCERHEGVQNAIKISAGNKGDSKGDSKGYNKGDNKGDNKLKVNNLYLPLYSVFCLGL